ncbi:MAG: TRM11 family SAM-dependent methyltransferase [Acidimicrobiia bacterium]
MPRTALLLKASANRVYGEAAVALGAAELAVLDEAVLRLGLAVERTSLGGVDYLVAEHAEPLPAHAVRTLSNLSSLHALYALDGPLLRPLSVEPLAVVGEDITTIQRYQGKTNEAFTHLLVNLALAAGGCLERLLAGERLRLLDPACGRGTTLNRAAVYGLDACGIELDQRHVEAYTVFLLTYLKDRRYKHKLEQAKLRKGRDRPAHRITVTYGSSKDRSTHRVVDVVHDDTRAARTHFKDRSMDLLVCDLPYGVQHGAHGEGTRPSRGPSRLLEAALPTWLALLRPGAGATFAWNLRTLGRAELEGLVCGAGFELVSPPGDRRFVHRVDQAIQRDVLVARRPGPAGGSGR